MSPWTEARIDALVALAADGLSARAIAEALNARFPALRPLTRNAVIGKSYRMTRAGKMSVRLPALPRVYIHNEATKAPKRPHMRAPAPRLPARPLPSPAIIPEEPMPVEPTSLHLSVMDLRADSCRFPHGDPKQPGFSFCGAKVWRIGSAWCRHHRTIVYRPVESRQGRAAA